MPVPFTRDTIKAFMRQNVVRCPSSPEEQANIPYVPGEPGRLGLPRKPIC